MLRTFSRWENSCSTMTTKERSDSAGQGSSILFGAPLVFPPPPSSSPAQGLRKHLGATARNKASSCSCSYNRIMKNVQITHQQAGCQKAKVHLGVLRDPEGTRRRRAGRAPCWPFLQSESSALSRVQMSWWLRRPERCSSVTNCRADDQRQKEGE